MAEAEANSVDEACVVSRAPIVVRAFGVLTLKVNSFLGVMRVDGDEETPTLKCDHVNFVVTIDVRVRVDSEVYVIGSIGTL